MYLKILWMYNDVMDLYGDKGNITALKYRCEQRNIDFILDTCTLGEKVNLSEYDMVFIGGGADKEQRILSRDLIERKEDIQNALNSGVFFLLICGGYQLFGKYYIDADGNRIDGLGIYDYFTKAGVKKNRCIGNIIVKSMIKNENYELVGFENHGGQTIGVTKPFAKVYHGHGNKFNSKYEGFYDGKVLGTYIHGPLLPKNTKLTDFIIKKVLKKRYGEIKLSLLDDMFEEKAVKTIMERYKVKNEKLERNYKRRK